MFARWFARLFVPSRSSYGAFRADTHCFQPGTTARTRRAGRRIPLEPDTLNIEPNSVFYKILLEMAVQIPCRV
jgi:hypothetical protein